MSEHLPTGRVVRMHFTCRAELPIGSSLRITGPTLWSPSATGLQATSTTPAAAISTASAATPTTAAAGAGAADASSFSTALASSVAAATAASHAIDESILAANCLSSMTTVELITTPETYPIWKTKTPVVIVLHKTKAQQIQHYYYRYFVMTPGATMEEYILTPTNNNNNNKGGDTAMADSDPSSAATPYSMPTPVLMWENPFLELQGQHPGGSNNNNKMHSALSTQSLQTGPSLYPAAGFSPGAAASGTTSSTPFKELANLPYRTLDIHVGTGTIMNTTDTTAEDGGTTTTAKDESEGSGTAGGASGGGNNPIVFVPLDNWNNVDDDTFRAYQIRESMERQQQQQQQLQSMQTNPSKILMKQISDVSDDFSMSDDNTTGTGTGGPQSKDKTAPPQQIYFICFHLPVVVVKVNGTTWKASWSESLLAQKEGSMIANTYRAHWVGTVTTHPPISSQQDMDEVRKLLHNMDCTPIFLPDHIRHAHYYGFCKQVLWPAFHNIDLLDLSTMKRVSDGKSSGAGDTATEGAAAGGGDAAAGSGGGGGGGGGTKASSTSVGSTSDWDQSRLNDWWNAYKTVNQEFATVVQNLVQDPDNTYLWIHDYHLSLLPRYLQMANPGEDEDSDSAIAFQQQQQQQYLQAQDSTPPSGTPTRTGRGGGGLSCRTVFFLHIPFPTSQIFRELECGQSILEGMLHADVVGFHAFDHARHFLNAAKRILGLNYESLVGGLIGVNFMGKTVLVSMSNVSIEPRMIDGK